MKKGILIGLLLLPLLIQAQCPSLIYPANGGTDVPVDAELSWTPIPGFTAIIISLGTTPDGVDILNRRTSGPITEYQPEIGLPENTLVYFNVILRGENGLVVECPTQSFFTGTINAPPECTNLADPGNGENGVPISSNITWDYAPRATGYRVTAGSTPGGNDIADNVDVGNTLSFNPDNPLPVDTTIFVTVTPYNRLGDALSCSEESFSTGANTVDCSRLLPAITFPGSVGLCPGQSSIEVSSPDRADAYRWVRILDNGIEIEISSDREVVLSELGNYRLELTEFVGSINELTGCTSTRDFQLIPAEPPVITGTEVTREAGGLRIVVNVAGNGNYEYALNPNGNFQSSNVFTGLPLENHTVYVRDLYGCGIDQSLAVRNLSSKDFPAFFTPNGDGINDYWQYTPPPDLSGAFLESLMVFDRYGNFISQIDLNSQGWDGNINGQPLPSDSYWFRAISFRQEIITGYFTLKR